MEKSFQEALGKIPSGIFVITACLGEKRAALLASWVQQAAFDPPTVTVAIHRDRPILGLLNQGDALAIHALATEPKELYQHFARGFDLGADPFEGLEIEAGELGSPILPRALSVLERRVAQRIDAGDHLLIKVRLKAGRMLAGGEPRVHLRKNGLNY